MLSTPRRKRCWQALLVPAILCQYSTIQAHDGHPEDTSFWAEGRQWNNYQEWSQSEEFQTNLPHYYCGGGMDDPTLEELEISNRVTQEWVRASTTNRQSNTPIRIPLKWHSIARDDGSGAANLEQILNSVAHLNEAYSHWKGGFFFDFDSKNDYTFSLNSAWHFSDDIEDTNFKSVLRRGDCSTLNIYTTASFKGVFGWGTKAFRCERGGTGCYAQCETDTIDDGVVIRYDLVTGGSVEAYNEGDVLVHEVGHWLGLYHTFQGGCSLPGDFIQDTPAESGPAYTCAKERDSCKDKKDNPPGLDPIHNYMDVSNDACMYEFTDGQFDWMYAQWNAYRAPPPTIAPTNPPTNPPTFPPATASPTFTVLNQQKEAPEAKCGTVATQYGYGGVAAQSKDCGSGRYLQEDKPRRRLKGS
jgi:Pregnancy-associated plasma protein-A